MFSFEVLKIFIFAYRLSQTIQNASQICILIVLTLTVIVAVYNSILIRKSIKQQRKSVEQQGFFNRTSLRPFVFGIPYDLIRFGMVNDSNYYTITCNIRNTGKTPAYDLTTIMSVTANKKYSVKDTVDLFNKATEKGFVFPGDVGIKKTLNFKYLPNGKNLPVSLDEIKDKLINSKFYLHLYIEYSYKYAFQATFYFYKLWRTQEGIDYSYEIVYSSPQKLQIKQ